MAGDRLLYPVASELLAEIRTRQCRVPTQNNIVGTRHCRVRPIIRSATRIDMISNEKFAIIFKSKIQNPKSKIIHLPTPRLGGSSGTGREPGLTCFSKYLLKA